MQSFAACHIRHDEGRCDRKDGLTVIETNASTAYFPFDRGVCKTVKGIAPWKGFGKPFGKILVEFVQSSFGVGSIAEKAVIFRFGQR